MGSVEQIRIHYKHLLLGDESDLQSHTKDMAESVIKKETVESASVTLPSAWGGANLVFTKRNGVVVVTRSGIIKNATINTDTQVGTIPNGYVPYTATNKIMYDYNSMIGNTYAKVPAIRLQFDSNGEITAYGYITAGVSLNLDGYICSYITQN